MMISLKKLTKMARKWQKLAASKRRRISLPRTTKSTTDADSCSTSSVAEKGHFVAYSADQKRFVLPLKYLNNDIFRELLNMAEAEFGLPSVGPITMPCDAAFMDYIVSLVRNHAVKDLQEALLRPTASGRCFPHLNLVHEQTSHQSLIFGY